MTRQQRYPNTKTFKFINVNPKGRITGDCVIRAIATATDTPYNEVVRLAAETTIETGYFLDNRFTSEFLARLGWVKCKQPRKADGTKYTGEQFCMAIQKYLKDGTPIVGAERISDRMVASIGSHHEVAIVDGKVNDIWDSTDGCIGNYWVKA